MDSKHQLGFLRPYGGKPDKTYGGAAYNALMEEETKESLVLLYLDALDSMRTLREECRQLQKRLDVRDVR